MTSNNPSVLLSDGRPVVLSTQVAKHFEKPHRHILRDVRAVLADAPGCAPNFGRTQIDVPMPTGGVRKSPAYELSRDGFTLLAMGFTGKKALRWKIRYIEAFNAMEEQLAKRSAPSVSPSQKRSIQEFITAKAKALPEDLHAKAYGEMYCRLKNKFNVSRYSELSETDYDRAIEYIQNMTLGAATSAKTLPPAPLVDADKLEARLLEMESSASKLVTEYFSEGDRLFRNAFTVINSPGTPRQNALLRMERVYVDGLMHLDASFRALRNNLATLAHI